MKSLLAVILLYVFWRGVESFFTPPKKPDKGKCKSCGVVIEAGEELCWHCEIVDYRKWKRDKK